MNADRISGDPTSNPSRTNGISASQRRSNEGTREDVSCPIGVDLLDLRCADLVPRPPK